MPSSEWDMYRRNMTGKIKLEILAIENNYESADDLIEQSQGTVQVLHLDEILLEEDAVRNVLEQYGLVFAELHIPECPYRHMAIGKYENFPPSILEAIEKIVNLLLKRISRGSK